MFIYCRIFRDTLPDYVFPDMLSILARLSHTLAAKLKDDKNKLNDKTIHMVELTTESFRSLRNACAGCKRNQEEVLRYSKTCLDSLGQSQFLICTNLDM